MAEEMIDKLIESYKRRISENLQKIECAKDSIMGMIKDDKVTHIEFTASIITQKSHDNEMLESFIESLEYAKTGERK